MTHDSPKTVAQRQAFTEAFGNSTPNSKPNGTGLPDKLKAGLESHSGMDLSDVKVHYNSTKPAQLQALAYAQGNEIHLGPGQEKHLPHEGWHVVQQRQGRVKPTLQTMQGKAINDDPRLEKEADDMGKKAFSSQSVKGMLAQAHEVVEAPIQMKTVKLNSPGFVELRAKSPNKKAEGYDTLTDGKVVSDLLQKGDLVDYDQSDYFISRTNGVDHTFSGVPQFRWYRINAFQKFSPEVGPVIDTRQEQYFIDSGELKGPQMDVDLQGGVDLFEDYREAVRNYKMGLEQQHQQDPDFEYVWNSVAPEGYQLSNKTVVDKMQVQGPLNVLVISEGADRNTGGRYEPLGQVDRTYYPDDKTEERKLRAKFGNTGGVVVPWDITQEPDGLNYKSYDIVIARSAICFCTEDSFACGGYDKKDDNKSIEALNRIANLLKPGGIAILTTGTLHLTGGDYTSDRMVSSEHLRRQMPMRPDPDRFDARFDTERYWGELFSKMEVSSEVTITPVYMGNLRPLGSTYTGRDIPNSLFAIVIYRKNEQEFNNDGRFTTPHWKTVAQKKSIPGGNNNVAQLYAEESAHGKYIDSAHTIDGSNYSKESGGVVPGGAVVQAMFGRNRASEKKKKKKEINKKKSAELSGPGVVNSGSKSFACFNIQANVGESYISANFSKPWPDESQLSGTSDITIFGTSGGTFSATLFQLDTNPAFFCRGNFTISRIKN